MELLHGRPQQVPPPAHGSRTVLTHQALLAYLGPAKDCEASAPELDSMPLLPLGRARWRSLAASTRAWMPAEGSPRAVVGAFFVLDSGDLDVDVDTVQEGSGACFERIRRDPLLVAADHATSDTDPVTARPVLWSVASPRLPRASTVEASRW